MKFVAPMDTWEMVGGNLPPIRVRARSFDEALKKQGFATPAIAPAGSLRRAEPWKSKTCTARSKRWSFSG